MLRKTFVHRGPLHNSADSISFSLYSSEEIKKMSVVKVITPLAFNSLGHPLYNGLYDPRLGPYNMSGNCATCQQTLLLCPGHFGHIELPLPVINPLFTKTLLSIFRLSCLICHSVTIPGNVKEISVCQLTLLQRGLMQEAQDVESAWSDEMKGQVEEKVREYDKEMDCDDGQEGKEFNGTGTRNVENIRRLILRSVLTHAKINKKCAHCGTTCRKMMLYESKLVYTLMTGSSTNYQDDEPMDFGEDDENENMGTARKIAGTFKSGKTGVQKYLTPLEARDHLRLVWIKESEFLSALFPVLGLSKDASPTDLLFVDTVPVPPPKNRPAQMVNNQMVEHPQNMALRNVSASCAILIYALQAIKNGLDSLSPEAIRALKTVTGATLNDKLESVWRELQLDVDHVMDRDRGSLSRAASGQLMGLKQIIEKKEGLFRMHMMGKRVNHAARTVITPDPNIHVEEIGIPDLFAKTLTIPVQVTPFNVHQLRQLVMNGPNVHPGAVYVESETGQLSRLDPNNENQRIGQAKRLLVPDQINLSRTFSGVKTVYRHLQNGDFLLLNRQPSLHRPSIMAHRARVLHGEKVFRLHYANCKHYNADFDGDEMNAHFPQSWVARAEAASIVNVCSNFLVPKDGTPLAGLIQDHIVAAVKLTIRGRFFNYADYQQLVYFALCSMTKPIITLPPAIMKPVRLWSGKQIVSTIIVNLIPPDNFPPTFYSPAKIKPEEWNRRKDIAYKADAGLASHMSESNVVFRHGHLVSGVLDKVQLGATQYGLCHAFYELYGNRAVGDLLSAFSKLLTNFLQWEGFTLGIKDVLVKPGADVERRHHMKLAAEVGPQAAAAGVSLERDPDLGDKEHEALLEEKLEASHRSPDPKARAIVDQAYKQHLDQFTNAINRSCLPYGLVSIFPDNNLQLLVQSGAKGSTVNTMQMSCLLGQIELEGKRPHLTMSGKSLPSFRRYDVTPRAGGFIAGRFLTGIRPQEFFFHCMAGREGLIDTAVKTSRSGYLQRCLVKLLEGVVTQYDGTVRDSDGSIIQFRYGEDGLDVGQSQYLKPKTLEFLNINSHIILKSNALKKLSQLGSQKSIEAAKQRIQNWKAIHGVDGSSNLGNGKMRQSPALTYFRSREVIVDILRQGIQVPEEKRTPGRTLETDKFIQAWRIVQAEQKKIKLTNAVGRCPDPLLSYMHPESNFGVVSEALQAQIETKGEDLKQVVYYKALRALSTPGDAVGVLAAQSIGEPSTQMTLNTFHFAGRGEMNVTLGIPRLREILMVASANIRTPSMDIPFKSGVRARAAEKLKLRLSRVTLENVLQYVEVKESVSSGYRMYTLKFQFLQHSDYAHQFCVRPPTVLKFFEKHFVRQRLCPAIRRAANMAKGASTSIGSMSTSRASRGGRKGGGGEDEPAPGVDVEDGDSPTAKNLYDEMEKRGMGEDHQSSDEEPDVEDADATQATRRARQTEAEYEEPEEEEESEPVDPELALAVLEEARRRGKKRGLDEDDDADAAEESASKPQEVNEEEEMPDEALYTVSSNTYDARIATVMALDGLIHDYDFDRMAEEHCTLKLQLPVITERINLTTILKEEAEKAVIHQVKNIKRAFIVEQGGKKVLKTEGINILAMTDFHDLLNLNQLHCNNVHTMAEHYGVEASARVIVKEMTDVFKAYGITLDPRHLTLIADYMTFSGTYRPFNRIGIESSPSPLQQMSFETVVSFLRDAILGGRKDNLKNPSARLVVGKPAQSGTGLFQLMNKLVM